MNIDSEQRCSKGFLGHFLFVQGTQRLWLPAQRVPCTVCKGKQAQKQRRNEEKNERNNQCGRNLCQ